MTRQAAAFRNPWGDLPMPPTPDGFKTIDCAPRDGTFVRLRFRPGILMMGDHEELGAWRPDASMIAGGWWFNRGGFYVTPGPLFWAPEEGGFQ
jgi:hypothetical protein